MRPDLHCGTFEDYAVLYVADELSPEDAGALERHARECGNCAAILSREVELRKAIASRPEPADVLDRSEFLLAQCRSELFEAIDDAASKPKESWLAVFVPSRWGQQFRRAFAFRPAWSAAALLIIGLIAGTAGREWYRQVAVPARMANPVPAVTVSAPAPITEQQLASIDLTGIHVEPQDDTSAPKIELQVRSPEPRIVQGTPDDAEIRHVLTYVIGHSHQFDDGVRLDSMDALRPKAGDPQVRAAMSEALRHDPNPAVRLKAIEALRGVSPEPDDVQTAILEALSDDDNSGVRIQALNTLFEQMRSRQFSAAPFGDRAMSILRDRMQTDSNSYIRSRSADVLGQLASMDEDSVPAGGRHP